ncbi:MAG: DUF308 domain-containing protein [Bacteroidales bacterium]|mgnify:CR=1 FL=1|nr:DUF308 domain-containing protein [Bacteroidales bacterium]
MNSFKSFFNHGYGYLRALLGIITGLVLLIWPDTMKDLIVRIIGTLFLVIGSVSLIIYFVSRKKAEKSQESPDKIKDNFLAVNAVLSIIFGAVLIIIPNVFVGFLLVLLGIILVIFGIGEIVTFISARKQASIPWYMYVLPCIVAFCGIFLVFNPHESQILMFRLLGAGFLVYGLFELFATIKIRREIKERLSNIYDDSVKELVEDVPYEEIKE